MPLPSTPSRDDTSASATKSGKRSPSLRPKNALFSTLLGTKERREKEKEREREAPLGKVNRKRSNSSSDALDLDVLLLSLLLLLLHIHHSLHYQHHAYLTIYYRRR